jgi:hypothetical protein
LKALSSTPAWGLLQYLSSEHAGLPELLAFEENIEDTLFHPHTLPKQKEPGFEQASPLGPMGCPLETGFFTSRYPAEAT